MTLLENVMLVRFEHPKNAEFAMTVTGLELIKSGMVTVLPEPVYLVIVMLAPLSV